MLEHDKWEELVIKMTAFLYQSFRKSTEMDGTVRYTCPLCLKSEGGEDNEDPIEQMHLRKEFSRKFSEDIIRHLYKEEIDSDLPSHLLSAELLKVAGSRMKPELLRPGFHNIFPCVLAHGVDPC